MIYKTRFIRWALSRVVSFVAFKLAARNIDIIGFSCQFCRRYLKILGIHKNSYKVWRESVANFPGQFEPIQ